MDFSGEYTLKRRPIAGPVEAEDYQPSEYPLDEEVAELGYMLMSAAVTFHKLHLKITGFGSFAAHKALNELYDALPELCDAPRRRRHSRGDCGGNICASRRRAHAGR